jgi:uncharacterized protein (DUF58 family)
VATRAGVFVLLVPILLGVAAVSSTNNLLFFMVGGALGAIVLSGILSERNIRGVRARIVPAASAHAGEPALLRVLVEREASLPAYGLRIRERPSIFRKPPMGLLDVTIGRVERAAEAVGARTFPARGRATLERSELVTTYPFGLLAKARDLDVGVEVVVRPRRVAVPEVLRDPRAIACDGEANDRRGMGIEVHGLRERREHDSVQRVHALRSMALGQDVVIETAAVDRPTAFIGLANDEGADPEALERAIEVAAAVIAEWDRRGFLVGLATNGQSIPPGAETIDRLLDRLALLGPEPRGRCSVEPPVWIAPAGAAARLRSIGVDRTGVLEGLR